MGDGASGLTRCRGCTFWRPAGEAEGTCHRHAPRPGSGAAEVAHWPETDATAYCGDAEPALAEHCGCRHAGTACIRSQSIGGKGLDPVDRLDQRQSWWKAAGCCMRHAPQPTGEPGCRGFWRADARDRWVPTASLFLSPDMMPRRHDSGGCGRFSLCTSAFCRSAPAGHCL